MGQVQAVRGQSAMPQPLGVQVLQGLQHLEEHQPASQVIPQSLRAEAQGSPKGAGSHWVKADCGSSSLWSAEAIAGCLPSSCLGRCLLPAGQHGQHRQQVGVLQDLQQDLPISSCCTCMLPAWLYHPGWAQLTKHSSVQASSVPFSQFSQKLWQAHGCILGLACCWADSSLSGA